MLYKRDNSIDILRFLGLSCIILAHIAPPNTLFQLRTFDVPLMVFISGLAYAGRSIGSYVDFFKRRLLRLIVPVYIFLCFYFILTFIFAQLGIIQQISLSKIVGSFLLLSSPSIGYIWVIRVFLIIMLLTPLLVHIDKRIKSNLHFMCLVVVLFVAQLAVTQAIPPPPSVIVKLAGNYIFYLGYSIPFLIGLRLKNIAKSSQWLYILVFAVAFVYMAIYLYLTKGEWLVMQSYKYPPQLYFLLWGTLVSSFLWATKEWWQKLFEWRSILFIAQNTIWIYLWHIPLVTLANKFLADAGWLTRFIVVYGLALLLVYIQSRLVFYIDNVGCDKSGFIKRYFKG